MTLQFVICTGGMEVFVETMSLLCLRPAVAVKNLGQPERPAGVMAISSTPHRKITLIYLHLIREVVDRNLPTQTGSWRKDPGEQYFFRWDCTAPFAIVTVIPHC